MIGIASFVQRHVTRAVAATCVTALFVAAQLPTTSAGESNALAGRFSFARLPLPAVSGYTSYSIRAVNPSLRGHAAWISAVGAAVALNDLDGDGLPNDVCYVDPRINQVIVAPVPGTPARYKPFTLNPGPLPYNPATMAPMGCLPGDFNEDGLMDILVYYWGRTPVLFLHRAGAAITRPLSPESYEPRELVPSGGRWYTNAVTQADLDGSGHVGLVIANYFPDGARILDTKATNKETMQASMSRAYNSGSKHLFLWAGATAGAHPTAYFHEAHGVLTNQMNYGWTLAVAACDLTGDLLPDIYFANDFGPDRLLYNESTPGHLRFKLLQGRQMLTTPPSKVLGHDSFKGMGVDCGDLSAHGLTDLFVSNIADEYALEESNLAFINTGRFDQMRSGVAPFVDRSEQLGLARSGWAWDAKMGDFDNGGSLQVLQATGFIKGQVDRWPELQELAMGNDQLLHDPGSWPRLQRGDDLSGNRDHDRFYVQSANSRFVDIAPAIGLGDPQVSRGIAVADVNGDGKLDFAVANQWGPSYFFRNDCVHCGEFLELHLLLPLRQGQPTMVYPGYPRLDMPGRPAIGATINLRLPNGRLLVGQVDGGNGHSGKRSFDIHIGLGQLPRGTQMNVQVHWRDPDGNVHRVTLSLQAGLHTILLGWPARKGR